MQLTANKALERVTSEDNLATRFARPREYDTKVRVMPVAFKGGVLGKPHLTVEEATAVAIIKRTGGDSAPNLGAEFDISRQSVNRIARECSTVDENKVDQVLNDIETKTLERLMKSLNLMDDDKMLNLDAKDLAGIAGNLSKVHGNITHKKDSDSGPRVNITIFAPEQRKESHYSTIEV